MVIAVILWEAAHPCWLPPNSLCQKCLALPLHSHFKPLQQEVHTHPIKVNLVCPRNTLIMWYGKQALIWRLHTHSPHILLWYFSGMLTAHHLLNVHKYSQCTHTHIHTWKPKRSFNLIQSYTISVSAASYSSVLKTNGLSSQIWWCAHCPEGEGLIDERRNGKNQKWSSGHLKGQFTQIKK